MKYLSWILTIPLAIVAVVFAVANRQGATLNIWPMGIKVEAPLFVLVLGSVLLGLIVGGFIAWLSAGASRRRGREAVYRAEGAERELAYLLRKVEQERAEAAAARAPSTAAPANDASRPAPSGQSQVPATRA